MNRCEEQSGDEKEVVNEEPELHGIVAPMVRSMERESEKQDVGDGDHRDLAEKQAGEEANRQRDLEERGDPREQVRDGKARSRELARRRVHANEHELEGSGHREVEGKNQPRDQDGRRLHRCPYFPPTSANSAPCGSLPMTI